MWQHLSGRYGPEAAVLRQQVGRRVRSSSVAAAVQRCGLAAHAQHVQGEEGLCLHVSVQWQHNLKSVIQDLDTELLSFVRPFPSSSPPFTCSLALFLVFVAAVLVLSLATGNIQLHAPDRQFVPIYLLKRNQAPQRYTTSLLVQNSSGELAGDFF